MTYALNKGILPATITAMSSVSPYGANFKTITASNFALSTHQASIANNIILTLDLSTILSHSSLDLHENMILHLKFDESTFFDYENIGA